MITMFKKVTRFVLAKFSYIFKHWEYLLEPFYPIVEDFAVINKLQSSKCHRRYILSFLIMFYFYVDNAVFYFTMSEDSRKTYTIDYLAFQFLPKYLVEKLRQAYLPAVFMFVYCLFALMWDKFLHLQHVMFPFCADSTSLT